MDEPTSPAGVGGLSIECPHCGAPLPVHPDAGFVTCAYCGAHLRVVGAGGERQLALYDGLQPREPVGQGAGIVVEHWGGRLVIRWRWFSFSLFFLLFFCIAWDSFLVFWYGTAFAIDAPWIMWVFPVGHVAVGVALTYATLAGFLNSTRVEVGQGMLTVSHGPLPWRGNVSLEAADVKQVYCTESGPSPSRDGPSPGRFNVMIQTASGREIKLISALSDRNHALYVEQEIERHLGIDDRPVSGEIPR